MQATAYVEINEYGSVVIAGTQIHVEAIGYAHEGGQSEADLMAQFSIDRVQLHGALAYFYQNRESLQQQTDQRINHAMDSGELQTDKIEHLRRNQDTR